MNFGLIGWGIASGVGSMNIDIVRLAPWIKSWLIPKHPNSKNHQEYLDEAYKFVEVIECSIKDDNEKYNQFLDNIDALLYVEHPVLKDPKTFDIVSEAKKKGKLVVGIPMWEWWPEKAQWAIKTDILVAATMFTYNYLNALSDTMFAHGHLHDWRGNVIQAKWGVNLNDFPYKKRTKVKKIVFVNGNGGYKLRKASDLVFEAFSKSGAPPLTVYTQKNNISDYKITPNITIIEKNFPERKDVYSEGDLFLFPSYWEGLCLGLYEAQACGSIVMTSEHPPMNECGSDYLLPVSNFAQEDLSGKKIIKAIVSAQDLYDLSKQLYGMDISNESKRVRDNIVNNFNLTNILDSIYREIINLSITKNLT